MSEASPAKPLRPSLPWARYPIWWKVAAAFAVGALIAAASLIKVLPKNAPGSRGGNLGFAPGEAGGTEDGEELLIDPKTGKIIRRSSIGGSTEGGAGGGGTLGAAGRAAGRSGSGTSVGGGGSGSGGSSGSGGGSIICAAGRNGGATEIGVTGTEVKLGATFAESGNAAAFLGQVRLVMDAVKNKVNLPGGVCGRQLTIIPKEDGWDPQKGFTKIRDLVEGEKVFALAVVPSSEGLNQASLARYFQEGGGKGVPVIGSDGMIRTQYTDSNIWPVASATITQLHVMMKEAWDRGARNPAIVFENTYRFGVEGAYAFNQAYRRLSGGDIPGYTNPLTGGGATCGGGRFCGIPAGTSGAGGQYGTQVSTINNACNQSPPCDFMVLLLEPITAQNWMGTTGAKQPKDFPLPTPTNPQAKGMGAAQPLFTYNFGYNCHDKCAGLWVWTGYNPPIEQYRNTSALSEYRATLQSQSAQIDEFNQFNEGGYVGMKLLIAALQKTPNLTRSNLIKTLDAMTLETGLAPTLTWSAGKHFANGAAQAFEIQSKNGFTGWRFIKNYIPDPWLGQDVG